MARKKKIVRLAAIHPGEFLREDFLKPLSLSVNALAMALHVPATRISEIVNERRGITTDTALRLATYFGTTPDFWINMQAAMSLQWARIRCCRRFEKEVQRRVA